MEETDKMASRERIKRSQQTITDFFDKISPVGETNSLLMIGKFVLTITLYGLLIALSPVILLVLFIVVIVAV